VLNQSTGEALEIETRETSATRVCILLRMMLRHHTEERHFTREIQSDRALTSSARNRVMTAQGNANGSNNFFARARKNSIAMSKKPGYLCRSSHPESL
jgi:hypothetical protein